VLERKLCLAQRDLAHVEVKVELRPGLLLARLFGR
jgi:hypothetical protein